MREGHLHYCRVCGMPVQYLAHYHKRRDALCECDSSDRNSAIHKDCVEKEKPPETR